VSELGNNGQNVGCVWLEILCIRWRCLHRTSSHLVCHVVLSQLPRPSTMATKYKRPKGRDGAISALNLAIDGFSLAKEISSATPAKAVFGSVSILLGMIKVTSFLLCRDVRPLNVRPGHHGQRTRLRRSRTALRQDLRNPQAGNGQDEARRLQQMLMRGDRSAKGVSRVDGT
jgi:hypothetical protein